MFLTNWATILSYVCFLFLFFFSSHSVNSLLFTFYHNCRFLMKAIVNNNKNWEEKKSKFAFYFPWSMVVVGSTCYFDICFFFFLFIIFFWRKNVLLLEVVGGIKREIHKIMKFIYVFSVLVPLILVCIWIFLSKCYIYILYDLY